MSFLYYKNFLSERNVKLNLKQRLLKIIPGVMSSLDIEEEFKLIIFRFHNTPNIGKKFTIHGRPIKVDISAICNSIVDDKIHIFYNADIWEKATDQELRGNVVHELCHLLLKKAPFFIPFDSINNRSDIFVANECIVDLIGVTFGYIDDIIVSKRYLSDKMAKITSTFYYRLKYRKQYKNCENIVGIPLDTFRYIKKHDGHFCPVEE
jgi:hypothetical protein